MNTQWIALASPFVVAAISAAALVIVRRLKGPVTIQDLWAENRQLRTDLDAVSQKVDRLVQGRETQLAVNRIMGEGFDALSAYVERDTDARDTKPVFTRAEHDAIARARALRDDDSVWITQNPHQKGNP